MSAPPSSPLQRVVILGHTGFIGRRLVAALREAYPHLEVRGLSNDTADLSTPEGAGAIADLIDDGTALVALSAIKRQLGDTLENFERNVAICANLARFVERRPVARLVYMSSAAVYGESVDNRGITEATPVEPQTYYGLAKVVGEKILRRAVETGRRTSFLAIRPPLVYGPGDHRGSYGPSGFAQAVAARMPITLWGDGTELREFLYVDDAARLIRDLTLLPVEGVLNLATGTSHNYAEVLEILCSLSSVPIEMRSRERSKPKVDHVFVIDRLRKAVPRFRFTPLREGIQVTLEAERGALSAPDRRDSL